MTAYLAYSYSRRLTNEELALIDFAVSTNRAGVYREICKISLIVCGSLNLISINLPLECSTSGVILSVPTAINIINKNSLNPISVKSKNRPQHIPVVASKRHKITITTTDEEEKLMIAKFFYGPMLIDQEILDLKGGDQFIDILTVIFYVVLFMCSQSLEAECFHVPLHTPHSHLLSLADGRCDSQTHLKNNLASYLKTNTLLQSQLGENETPPPLQIMGFVKNGVEIDIEKAYNEVLRRASEFPDSKFSCSLQRFIDLATENGKITPGTTREAITVLNGEALGYYSNSRRGDYGPTVSGIDFVVEGQGPLKHITHVEVKNPVSSNLLRPKPNMTVLELIKEEGIKIAKRILNQKEFWSDIVRITKDITIKLTSQRDLPKSPQNVLAVFDLFDVIKSEIPALRTAIMSVCKNDTNIRFINTKGL